MAVLTASTSVLVPVASNKPLFKYRIPKAWLPGIRAFFVSVWGLSGLNAWAFCEKTPADLAALTPVTVDYVIDGDSLQLVSGEQLRLIGVNTPEMKGPQPLAAEAKARLKALIAGQTLYFQPGAEPKDKYQRLLGHLFLPDGRNIEAVLLEEGLGFLVAIPPNLALLGCQQLARDTARRQKQGVWAQAYYQAKAVVAVTDEDTGFIRLQGRLQSVAQSRNAWWLQLDGPVVMKIADKNQGYFDWQQLRQRVGRPLVVSGWMVKRRQKTHPDEKYSPYVLLLSHPKLLEWQ